MCYTRALDAYSPFQYDYYDYYDYYDIITQDVSESLEFLFIKMWAKLVL